MRRPRRSRGGWPAAVFYAVNVMLFPFTLVGYVLWVGALLFPRRESGVSRTAQGPLTVRWTEHMLGTRQDEPARRLMRVLPGVPPLALTLVAGPLLIAHRLSGYVPAAFRYPFEGEVPPQYEASARVAYFDQVVEQYLSVVPQFVILGAGFDTRALRLPTNLPVRAFEVDTPATQAVKRRMLNQARLDATRITFVVADFEREDWFARLVETGFDPAKPALFLWEGVTMYLDRPAVEATLRQIAAAAPGSAVAFDYFTTEALESDSLYWRYGRATTRLAHEPLQFGIDSRPPLRERTAELLRACGLTLTDQRTLGHEDDGQRAWGGFAKAVV